MKKGIKTAIAVIAIAAAAGSAWYFIGQPSLEKDADTKQTSSVQQVRQNMEAASASLASLRSKDPSQNRTYKKGTEGLNNEAGQTTDANGSEENLQDEPLQQEQSPTDQTLEEQPPADPPQEETQPVPQDQTDTEPSSQPDDNIEQTTDNTQNQEPPADPPQEEQPPADPSQEEQPPTDPAQEEQPPVDPTQEEQQPADPTQEDPQPADPWQDIDDATRARAQFILNNFNSFSGAGLTETDAVYYARIFGLMASQRPYGYIDAETLMGIAYTESRYDTYAVAQDGSGRYLGLMQLHESYEAHYGYGEGQLFDPYCNVECACQLLDECAAYYGYDLTKTILAYHWGPIPAIAEGTVDQYYTRDYVYPIAEQIRSMY